MRKNILLPVLVLLTLAPQLCLAQAMSVTSRPANIYKVSPYEFTAEIKPGESAVDTVLITNSTDQPTTITLTGVDPFTNQEGKTSYKLSTDTQTDAGLWIVPEQKTVEIAPKQQAKVNFTISVPAGTELKNYLAGISVDVKSIASFNDKNGQQVRINVRKIEKVNIKVTDNPQPVEIMTYQGAISWAQIYLWSSLGIFVLALAIILFTQIKKRRLKKKHGHSSSIGTEEKK